MQNLALHRPRNIAAQIKAASTSNAVRCFVVLFTIGFAWALYTQHAWEDYYITYRASKNLAEGNGLTFTAGERVHSFTSPLGVLLPALAHLLTGNRSDVGALWIFRVMSIAAFAGAGLFLWRLARVLFSRSAPAFLLIAFFAADAKIIDFSTNGMETGFLLLFLSWTLYALLAIPSRQHWHLGGSWAGLMWTRPDSFIYIGALAIATLLLRPTRAAGVSRWTTLQTFLTAGLITTLLYLPWVLWAWSYYGSPVPHTITAKALFTEPVTFGSFLKSLREFPKNTFEHRAFLTTTFMPPYSFNTGWPPAALQVSFWLGLGVLTSWLLPRIRPETRIVSFAFFVGQIYLTNYVGFPVPWYLPTITLFALFVISSVLDQFLAWKITRPVVFGMAALLLAGELTIFSLAAHQLRCQQRIIEEGQRTAIGRWLRANARSEHDTVFLEPLGYIGFYSNLKMLDYPGLSSPEVVAARKRIDSHAYPFCWAALVQDLQPDWMVLRPPELAAMREQAPLLFSRLYSLAKTFDVRTRVGALPFIAGRDYLGNDAVFDVYRHASHWPDSSGPSVAFRRVTTQMLAVNDVCGNPTKDNGAYLPAHAPSRFAFKKPKEARWLAGTFRIAEGAYANKNPENATDGAVFSITWVPSDGTRREIFSRALNPYQNPADRGHQPFDVEFPTETDGSIELTVSPGPSGKNNYDWTDWSSLTLVSPIK